MFVYRSNMMMAMMCMSDDMGMMMCASKSSLTS